MCPSAPPSLTDDISIHWTDEELCISLDRMNRGSPLPGNVIADVNPYQYKPSNLPDGIWYFRCSEDKKDAETGFWKAKGEACRIFTNSVITGWRTTFEFYEEAPHGRKTDWVIQEYRVIQKGMHGNSRPKDSNSLCRVFLCGGQSSNNEMQHNLTGADIAGGNYIPSKRSVIPCEENKNTGQGSTSRSQVNSGDDASNPLPETERILTHPVVNMPEIDYFSSGDFLELLDLQDLQDPQSPSSSSEASSCLSMSSDKCFDSLAFLHDLESEDKRMQWKDADSKCVLASVGPKEVVMHPATAGSLISGGGNKSPADALKADSLKADYSLPTSATGERPQDRKVLNPAMRNHKAYSSGEGPSSNSRGAPALSSGDKPAPDKEKATLSSGDKPAPDKEKETASSRPRKLRKKYFCFIPY